MGSRTLPLAHRDVYDVRGVTPAACRALGLRGPSPASEGPSSPPCPTVWSRDPVSTTVVSTVRFESAHFLPHVPPDHKCRRVHGHSYRCEIHVTGPVDAQLGWVADFAEIRRAFEPIRKRIDHHLLNEIEGLENPTSEVLARWIWDRVAGDLPGLVAVEVRETCTSGCTYRGED
jgi:6-pyruvoyltetrahydropterin/6-carboxytetrahydropterin synthase